MELRTCEFCGTEYGLNEQKCPICGRGGSRETEEQPEKQKRRLASSGGGARVAGKKQKKQKRIKTKPFRKQMTR